MRRAVSNVAWEPEEDDAVLALMEAHGITGLEVAPTKIWPQPADVPEAVARAYRARWEARGVHIVALQSLLFGQDGLELFTGPEVRARMLDHLTAIVRLGAWLGARAMVFGSPRSRLLHGMDRADALEVAVDFFGQVADMASRHGATICLEANPAAYGSEFAQTTAEAAEVVRRVGRPGFGLQLDTGSLALTGEGGSESIDRFVDLIAHVHVSEPHLRPFDGGSTDHRPIAAALRRHRYDAWVSLEMRSGGPPSNVQALDAALRTLADLYGD